MKTTYKSWDDPPSNTLQGFRSPWSRWIQVSASQYPWCASLEGKKSVDAPGSVGGSLSVGAVSRGSHHRRRHIGKTRGLFERNQGSRTWAYCNLNYFGLRYEKYRNPNQALNMNKAYRSPCYWHCRYQQTPSQKKSWVPKGQNAKTQETTLAGRFLTWAFSLLRWVEPLPLCKYSSSSASNDSLDTPRQCDQNQEWVQLIGCEFTSVRIETK